MSSLASDHHPVVDAAAAFAEIQPRLDVGRLLVASDFDGTLARLDPDPWGARMLPAARRSLRRLAGLPSVRVALISGRTVADLAARARVGGISYRGDHGAERAEARRGFRPASLRPTREPAPVQTERIIERLRTLVPVMVDEPWLVLEDKVTSMTFHFRASPDVDGTRRRVLEAVDRVDPDGVLARGGSRRAVELRPPGASTKEDALLALVARWSPDLVLMLGDDPHDARAFDVVRRLRDDGTTDGLALAVAGHPDVTRDVAPHADLVLGSPGEAAGLLRRLADEIAAPR